MWMGSASAPPGGTVKSTFKHPVQIGGDVAEREFFQGSIDDVMIFDRALTGAEIAQICRSQR